MVNGNENKNKRGAVDNFDWKTKHGVAPKVLGKISQRDVERNRVR